MRADYHIASGSVAINNGAARTTGGNGNRVPVNDYDGQIRPATTIDVGADEIAPAALPLVTGFSPGSGLRPASGTTNFSVTLTGANLLNAVLTESSGGFAVNSVVVNTAGTQITANVAVSSNAPLGANPITVTTPGGIAVVDFVVYPPPPPPVTFSSATLGTLNNAGTTLNFGNRNGSTSSAVTVTVSGSSAVSFQAASVANGSPAAFTLGTDTCAGTTRNPGETCTVTVNFTGPAGNSNRTGTLSVPYTGASGSPLTLGLIGS